jgi:hypothetical protein
VLNPAIKLYNAWVSPKHNPLFVENKVINCSNLVSSMPMHNLGNILKILTFNTSDQKLLFISKRRFMNNNNFDAIIEDLSIEDLRAEYAELTDSYDNLMFDYETLKLKVKMLEIKNRNLKAKLNKSEKTQELVYDGLGDR